MGIELHTRGYNTTNALTITLVDCCVRLCFFLYTRLLFLHAVLFVMHSQILRSLEQLCPGVCWVHDLLFMLACTFILPIKEMILNIKHLQNTIIATDTFFGCECWNDPPGILLWRHVIHL